MVEQKAKLGAAGKHAIRLSSALCDQIIDKHTNVTFVAPDDKRRSSSDFLNGVYSGDDPLPCSLLVAGSPVDLAGKKKILNLLGFQRRIELSWGREVIFNSVGWTQYYGLLQARNAVDHLHLNLEWHAG